jgi:hypothetical protein
MDNKKELNEVRDFVKEEFKNCLKEEVDAWLSTEFNKVMRERNKRIFAAIGITLVTIITWAVVIATTWTNHTRDIKDFKDSTNTTLEEHSSIIRGKLATQENIVLKHDLDSTTTEIMEELNEKIKNKADKLEVEYEIRAIKNNILSIKENSIDQKNTVNRIEDKVDKLVEHMLND